MLREKGSAKNLRVAMQDQEAAHQEVKLADVERPVVETKLLDEARFDPGWPAAGVKAK
jgi:hypothetical protein